MEWNMSLNLATALTEAALEAPDAPAHRLVIGRISEMGVIQALLDDVLGGVSRVLVLQGQPGIGKTALLQEMAERAAKGGLRLARTTGVQVEIGFDFAGLHQVLTPFLGGLAGLPDRQRAALETAFGLRAGPGSGPFLAGLAALTLLTDAAEEQPVLCVVDDAQWLDRASLEVLVFVARRLLADRVGMVFATRIGAERAEALNAFPELAVEALPPDAGRELLELAAGGRVPEAASRRVLAEAAGHPLALVELGRELREGRLQAAGTAPGLPLRLGERLESLYRERMSELPPAARRLLLLAAAEYACDADRVWRAAEALDVDPEAALLPEVRRMLSLSSGAAAFSHPLMRTAAYWGATPGDRRQAHAALADATDPLARPYERALHRSQAAEGQDETVARDLEAAADRARLRGGWGNQFELLQHAARLSAHPARRAERLLAAAEAGLAAGDGAAAAGLAEQAGTELREPLVRARVLRVRAHYLRAEGRIDEGVELLVEAALLMGQVHPRRARDTLLEGFSAAQHKGWLKTAEVLRNLPPPAEEAPGDGLLEGFAALHDGRTAEGYDLLRAGVRSLAAVPDWSVSGITSLIPWLYAAALLFDHTAFADLERRRIPGFRHHGEMAAMPPALYCLGYHLLRVGDLPAAAAALAEGRALSEAVGDRGWLVPFRVVEILVLGLRGDAAEGRALSERLQREPFPAQWRDNIGVGLAVLELGAGRYEAALHAALDARRLWPLLSPEDAIEAAMRCGQTEVARSALAEFAPAAEAAGSSWAQGILARCRALLAADAAEAEDDYLRSVELLRTTPVTLALARSHLVYGEWLRRQRRRRDARVHLRAALESFERLRIDGFAARTRAELAATGEHSRSRTTGTSVQLTPQELQIARMAAGGATNRAIAAQLFLSAATVNYHLCSVYRKLGISRRAGLALALVDAGMPS
jgi:DNA-binding CsgD family transcriptional regulator